MKDTLTRVEDIAPIGHREAMELAEAEYKRFADVLAQLEPDDWAKQTVNDDWDVKQLVAHNLGFGESNASFRVFAKAMRAGKKPMGSYLMDVVFTRDTWMHRIDICRAVGLDPVLTSQHDGRLIEDMVAEWARLYGLDVTLHLEGTAGRTYVSGTGDEDLAIDAVEWIWILSGRGAGTGLLAKELPL